MRLPAGFDKFTRVFWVVNALELLERGAYYGMLAVLPYHLVYNLKFPTMAFGLLLTILMPFLYILPIISGALAERYGYRRALVPSFIVIAIGYAAAGFASSFEMTIAAFIVLGIGTGTFKPITSGTIAHATSEQTRNLGYSIYYWMINVGSFAIPLVISFAFPKETYQYVFFLASGLIAANFFLSFFLYENPMPPNPEKGVSEVLKSAALVFKDTRLMILIIIYAGFWFMYAMNNVAILLYMVDFRIVADWFPPALVNVVNPATIILVGLWLGKIVEKYDSLHCMVAGITIFIIGMFTMGITTNVWIFFFGIVIFSVGEFITHPTYIAYLSKLAPKEKLPVYMGYGFLPTLIGYTAGNIGGALLYTVFSEEMHRPKFFWTIICSVGIATIAALLLYSQTLGKKRREEIALQEAKTRAVENTNTPATPVEYKKDPMQAFWTSRIPIVAMLLIMPGILAGAYAGGTDPYFRDAKTINATGWNGYATADGEPINITGTSNENTDIKQTIDIPDRNLISITFSLSWKDEADMQRLLRTYENQPDEFGLEVSGPDGANASVPLTANVHGQEGTVSVTINIDPKKPEKIDANNTFAITVKCGKCGDFTARASLVAYTDTGNDWTLDAGYQYHTQKTTKR